MTGPVLETRGVTRRYGGLVANNDVSLSLAAGEVRGLIGPNGAGKTTLVNVVTGTVQPDKGSVRLDGRPITGLLPHRIARLGLVRSFQTARVFPGLTVVENLMIPHFAAGAQGGLAVGRERAAEMLKLATLEPLANAPAGSLSGGQRMLLQAAAGFMTPSLKVYVLDEPFAGINPVVKDALIGLIEHENRAKNIAFLIVSHEMEVIRRLCAKVTVMIQGAVAAEGTLDEVASREDVITAYLGRTAA